MQEERIIEEIFKNNVEESSIKLSEIIQEEKISQKSGSERDSEDCKSIDSMTVNTLDKEAEEIENRRNCLNRITRELVKSFSQLLVELLNYKIKYKYLNCISNIKNSFHESISE